MAQSFKLLFIVCSLIITFSSDAETQTTRIYTGESITIKSQILGEDRTLLIKLPSDYEHRKDKRYPVLFVLDGETHFFHASGTVHWLSEKAYRIPHMLVVAITNANRMRDMTAGYNNGGADDFLAFFENELIPFIDGQYRTEPFRLLAGHSMAGHFALNSFVQKPELFNAYIAMSPFFNQDWGDKQLTDKLESVLQKESKKHHFIYGSLGDEQSLRPKYTTFVSALENSNDKSLEWYSQIDLRDDHMSTPSNTLNNALLFVFEPQRLMPTSEIAAQGLSAIRQYFNQISKDIYGYNVSDYVSVSRHGYHLLNTEKQVEKAVEVFEDNASAHPLNLHAHKDLAYAYNKSGQYQDALEAIERAIALTQPTNSILGYLKRQKQRFATAIQNADGN